jgi:predicted GH43/DUF377 family glycosyl hydrolase
MINVRRLPVTIAPNYKKVVARFLSISSGRIGRIGRTIYEMEDEQALATLDAVKIDFGHRHPHFRKTLEKHYALLEGLEEELKGLQLTTTKKLLLGAYFTHEYSIEAAAVFNPAIVPHPDQTDVREGELRFVMNLRSVGEGHISSISFRTGIIKSDGTVELAPDADLLSSGDIMDHDPSEPNYDIHYDASTPVEARVIFPYFRNESNGIEDVRFVLFQDGDFKKYVGTYTAFDGQHIRSQMIKTTDFQSFEVRSLAGLAIHGKGMALFPEKVGGKYAMIGRQDGQNLSMMYSEDLHKWESHQKIQSPERPWELLQIGNCGSPIKTEEGWLLLTHAVGPMRKYALSASLLDLEKPEKVIASLDEPLISPSEEEREGYVPNVVYTCGWIRHRDNIIIPYAISDRYVTFSTVNCRDLLQALRSG